eukprot:gb/GFBE01039507.1/.p1 GENE.gb/GFBE01039507.1/~~gb/GFBE01039507.1/.p1  ORF type:complete len:1003 (+),score=281.85 gb/GFBE01039507.1/:1-3009(+)
MPKEIPFEWREDENSLVFALQVRGVKAKNVSVALCDVYVKVNCHPSLFEVDLKHDIDPEHPKTRCRVSPDKVTLTLQKKEPGIWGEFRAEGTKAELRARREVALAALEEREKERQKKKEDYKHEMIKKGETEQWRLDSENRQTIEKWEKEEREKWEAEVYKSFDEDTGALIESAESAPRDIDDYVDPADRQAEEQRAVAKEAPAGSPVSFSPPTASSASKVQEVTEEEAEEIRSGKSKATEDPGAIWTQQDLDDTEEYVPDVRSNPGKIGIRFTERPRPGVPVRDRGQRKAPPYPKDAPKTDGPPMIAGDDFEDESDPVWLKDKADRLMTIGDYQGAYNAYTEALKLASNARAFANRAVAQMYLGNLEQCLEDCNNAIRILDLRNRPRPGEMANTADPQDQKVRARVLIRMGTAYLWLGAFGKAETHFEKAVEVEEGLDALELKEVKADLERIRQAKEALKAKESADAAARKTGGDEKEAMETAVGLYDEADSTSNKESAVIFANRSFAQLRAGQLKECLRDADAALEAMKRWPCANKAPKAPARPTRLDPPYLDDPTFKHPDQQNQGERDWLMKHNGGSTKDLPGLPPEYEWIKDVAEKNDNAWIAVRRKMPQAVIDAIKRNTAQLQDAVYMRQPYVIRQQIEVAISQQKAGEGPSNQAIKQAEDYAVKLEENDKEQEAEREKEEALKKQEADEFDLEEALAPRRSGLGQAGFGHNHPVERTRRRLFVKTLLRRSRAHELLGQAQASADDLRSVLKVEPENPEAKQRLAVLEALAAPASASSAPAPPASPAEPAVPAMPAAAAGAGAAEAADPAAPQVAGPAESSGAKPAAAKPKSSTATPDDELDDDDEDGGGGRDHASTVALLASAAEYMKKADYPSALQIYNYARNTVKTWESPMVELKALSNTSLCLQRIRGRLPELIAACNATLRRIAELREDGECKAEEEEMLLRMEAASLSRRGSAYAQQRKTEQSAEDAARVKELLARVEELEAAAGKNKVAS